jgi:hypothetical protein
MPNYRKSEGFALHQDLGVFRHLVVPHANGTVSDQIVSNLCRRGPIGHRRDRKLVEPRQGAGFDRVADPPQPGLGGGGAGSTRAGGATCNADRVTQLVRRYRELILQIFENLYDLRFTSDLRSFSSLGMQNARASSLPLRWRTA